MQHRSVRRHASTETDRDVVKSNVSAFELRLNLEVLNREAPRATPPIFQSHKGASRHRAAPGSRFLVAPPGGGVTEAPPDTPHWSCMPQPRDSATAGVAHDLKPPKALAPLPQWRYKVVMCSIAVHGLRSNSTFNRTSNGVAPWPRGSCGSSSASRPGRHTVGVRLTPR